MPMRLPKRNYRALRSIRRNRPKMEPGMVFAMQTAGGHFLFGRLVKAVDYAGKCALVYVYKHISKSIDDVPVDLTLNALLLPQRIVAQNMWTTGFFVKIGDRPFAPNELMKHHVFQWGPQKVNEDGKVVEAGPTPTEMYRLETIASLQADIQDATGNRKI